MGLFSFLDTNIVAVYYKLIYFQSLSVFRSKSLCWFKTISAEEDRLGLSTRSTFDVRICTTFVTLRQINSCTLRVSPLKVTYLTVLLSALDVIEIQYFLYVDDFDGDVDCPPFALKPRQRYFRSGGLWDTLIILLALSGMVHIVLKILKVRFLDQARPSIFTCQNFISGQIVVIYPLFAVKGIFTNDLEPLLL